MLHTIYIIGAPVMFILVILDYMFQWTCWGRSLPDSPFEVLMIGLLSSIIWPIVAILVGLTGFMLFIESVHRKNTK